MDIIEETQAEQAPYKAESLYQSATFKDRLKPRTPIKTYLKFSSSICAVLGGSLVASNTIFSAYGFLLLVLSSSQLLVSSILEKDLLLIFYAASVFIFVDCLGVYRWLLI